MPSDKAAVAGKDVGNLRFWPNEGLDVETVASTLRNFRAPRSQIPPDMMDACLEHVRYWKCNGILGRKRVFAAGVTYRLCEEVVDVPVWKELEAFTQS